MELKTIEKSDLNSFVQNLVGHCRVEGVKRKSSSFYHYGPIDSPEDLCLDFDCTINPPKKYFLPPNETLLRFSTGPDPEVTPVVESSPLVLFGVHPYDIKAINQMDRIFADGVPDPHYRKTRESVLLIGVDPTKAAPRSFWADMEANTVSNGFDLMFTDIGKSYLVESGSEKGEGLLMSFGSVRPATKDEAQIRLTVRSKSYQTCKANGLAFPHREIPILLEHSGENLLWEEKANKCLSCGTCNLVCPTCYCFDVQDDMDLGLEHGERFRRWDGCLLDDFAKVASGENFRETRTARYRHRFFRKGLNLFKILNEVACVGCGRCASSCLPDIADPVDVFNKLKEAEKN